VVRKAVVQCVPLLLLLLLRPAQASKQASKQASRPKQDEEI
jgi:hypothetical protein